MNYSYVGKINTFGTQVLRSKYFEAALSQKHHNFTTVGDHSLNVAYYSLLLAGALDHVGLHTSEEMLVRASLCHDLGIVGRSYKFRNNRQCCRQHPIDSGKVAKKILPDITEKEEDAIEHHMWPLNFHCPHCKEGWIISVADKISAMGECFAPGAMRHRDDVIINVIAVDQGVSPENRQVSM